MHAMMQFRIGNAPTRSARRRKFSSCMAYLDIVLYQDVKWKSHHHLARSHTSGNHLNLARQMRQADLSLSPGSQVSARALLPLDWMDQRYAHHQDHQRRDCSRVPEAHRELQGVAEEDQRDCRQRSRPGPLDAGPEKMNESNH